MKRFAWPLLLLVLWCYGGVAMCAGMIDAPAVSYTPVWVWLAGLVGLCVVNIAYALCRKPVSALPGMMAKLALIPFYVLVFIVGMMVFIALPAVIILFLLDGLLMLTTSAYTIRCLVTACRERRLHIAWTIVLAISQGIFVLDVPGSIVAHCLTSEKKEAPPC